MNKPWKIIDLVYFIGTHDSQPGDTDLKKQPGKNHETETKVEKDRSEFLRMNLVKNHNQFDSFPFRLHIRFHSMH